ncbi:hypothetical protein [Pseudonocardia sp. TRM90224]|uniref:hypothetical protein n=1 Tax=Pseudonocardia sp. TRM90224 TaxID=2812678 RepID=UPI001E455152|nr:hypothetical protein [Pseudonocardia sp. TRM90224]
MITVDRQRPIAVTAAAALQAVTAVPFVLGTVVVLGYGASAQAAAEAEMTRQGLPPSLLVEHGIAFGSNTAELPFAIAIVVVLAALAVFNLRGSRAARTASWVVHPVLLVAGTLIIPGQVFTTWYLSTAFAADPALSRIDAAALVDAAAAAMPGWLLYANIAKLVLTTVGSMAVVALLALPSARAHFRVARR